jgi:hypothetical protein
VGVSVTKVFPFHNVIGSKRHALDCLVKVRRRLCEIVFGCEPFALNLRFKLDVTLELRRSKHTRVAGEQRK